MNSAYKVCFLTCLLFLLSCVERKFVITSTPAGAEVYIDGKFVGKTPVEVPFFHYGTRAITLRKWGHPKVVKIVRLTPPFYSVFPLDFIAEVLLPYPFQDIRSFHFVLPPKSKGERKDQQGNKKK